MIWSPGTFVLNSGPMASTRPPELESSEPMVVRDGGGCLLSRANHITNLLVKSEPYNNFHIDDDGNIAIWRGKVAGAGWYISVTDIAYTTTLCQHGQRARPKRVRPLAGGPLAGSCSSRERQSKARSELHLTSVVVVDSNSNPSLQSSHHYCIHVLRFLGLFGSSRAHTRSLNIRHH